MGKAHNWLQNTTESARPKTYNLIREDNHQRGGVIQHFSYKAHNNLILHSSVETINILIITFHALVLSLCLLCILFLF